MAVYGVTKYGTETYGYAFPPTYSVDPFTSAATDYQTITLKWMQPVGTIQAYRLVRNQYGYPVDQDDGDILIDSLGYPGSQYKDTAVIPGRYYYYAIFVATNLSGFVWVKAGLTACLAMKSFDSSTEITDLIPAFYINAVGADDVVSASDQPNVALQEFIQVFGWGMDMLKTQYDTYLHVNDPWIIPQSQLYNLATQLGLEINPDIHPYTLRKAIFNNAQVNKERGTASGIATEVSSLTGWNVDLQIGPNIMLDNDQSAFIDPVYPVWSQYLNYNTGERVSYSNGGNTYIYQCINATNIGNTPSGSNTNNTWWNVETSIQDATVLANTLTSGINTWELIYPAQTNGAPSASSIKELLGLPDPLNAANVTHASLQGINGGSAQDIWLRSVSRTVADMATVTTTFAADKYQAIADGIPVPYTLSFQVWSSSQVYDTGDIVTYNNVPFLALRQSKGATPPYLTPGLATTEWTPLSLEPRLRLMLSGYALGNTNRQVVPFMEWYDANGNYITRVVSRNPTPGAANIPNQLVFDSFTTGVGNNISGRNADAGSGATWTQQTGTFNISPVNKGSVYPATVGQRTVATQSTGVSDTQLGLTIISSPRFLNTNYDFLDGDFTGWVNTHVTSIVQKSINGPHPWEVLLTCVGGFTNAEIEQTNARFAAAAATNYNTSCWVNSPVTSVNIGMNFYDNTSTFISSVTQSFTVVPNTWTYLSKNVTSPAGTVTAAPRAGYAGTPAAGTTLRVQHLFATDQDMGIALRRTDDTHYIRAGRADLRSNNGGTWTVLGTYSQAFAGRDRMTVQLNGTGIVVLRNGVSVLSTTSSFNQTATVHGMIVENI